MDRKKYDLYSHVRVVDLSGWPGRVSRPVTRKTVKADSTEMRILATAKFATVSVTTQNSTYLVVLRPTFIRVICPDGVVIKASTIKIVANTMMMRDHNGRRVLSTTQIKSASVLEN